MAWHWLGLDLTEKSVPCYIKPSRLWNGSLLTKKSSVLNPCSAATWLCAEEWREACVASWAEVKKPLSGGDHSSALPAQKLLPAEPPLVSPAPPEPSFSTSWMAAPGAVTWGPSASPLASGQTPGVPIGFGRRFEVPLPPPHLWALHGRTESVFDSANGAREGTLGAGGQGEREELTWAQPWCHSALHQPSQTLNPMSTRKTVRTSYMDHIPLSPTLKQF